MSKLYLNNRLCNGNARSKKTPEEQNQYTLEELKQVAKDNGVPGVSGLNKEALCQAILNFAKKDKPMIVGPPMVKEPVAVVPVVVRNPTPKAPVLVRVPSVKVQVPQKGKTVPAGDDRGCVQQFDKKYTERKSPAFPANQCCGMKMLGNDGRMYESRADKNGTCKWYIAK